MKCPNCNYELTGTEEECPSCGQKLKPTLSSRISTAVDNKIGPEGFAPIGAKLTKINNTIGVVIVLFILAIEVGLFSFALLHGLPWYIPPIFLVPTLLMFWLILRSNRKISQIDFKNPQQNYVQQMDKSIYKGHVDAKPGTNPFGEEKISLDPGESILSYLTPIYRYQGNFTGPSQVSVERFTENVIAVTDRRVLFFTAALPGQGMLIAGASQDLLNDELKRNTLRQMVAGKIDELKTGNSIEHFPNDFWIDRAALSQVQYLKSVGPVKYLYAGALGFKPEGGKKLKYQVVDRSNFDDFVTVLNAQKKMVI